MKTIEFKGRIEYIDSEGTRINIVDGENTIDLVDELESAINEYGNEVQVNYWITEKPCTKDEMIEGVLKNIYGVAEAENENYYTGSWTYGSSSYGDYENRARLKIGGHDLCDELSDANGEFIIIEFNFNTP